MTMKSINYFYCTALFLGVFLTGGHTWSQCPSGTKAGFTSPAKTIKACLIDRVSYGRTAGFPWEFGDPLNLDNARARCAKEYPQGCEKYGAIIYPKCRENYTNSGCCVCRLDIDKITCPAGWKKIGGPVDIVCQEP